ncbi:hypothetical protein ACIPJS_26625 [Streptomyces sp. NPDC086783]|uniref:hypothetical protein n=1 Tax=Streptomyces sp. NPDC086783 TaxID=3365758 RepID=UPI00380E085B
MAGYESGPAGSGADALWAAIMDEPLPEEVRDDAAVLAEHRSAAADVALLRQQLTAIGDALAGDVPARERAPERAREPVRNRAPARRTRRPLRLALGTLVAAVAATVVAGMGWLVTQGGGMGAADSSASGKSAAADAKAGGQESDHSPALRIACSRVLVEGTVVSLTPRHDGDVRVVLKVKRYYRPQESVKDRPTITVTLDGSAREDLRPGVRTLVRVPVRPETDRQDWEVGRGIGDAREDILKALPGAEHLTCPAPQGDGGKD